MPRVRLILEDDHGNPLPNTEQVYVLEGDCDTINQIETAVETFKKSALPPLEQALLTQAQERFVNDAQKRYPDPQRKRPGDETDPAWGVRLCQATAAARR